MAEAALGRRALLYAGLTLIGLQVAGCNTLQGAGKDIQKIGEVVEDGAEKAGDAVDEAVD